MKMKRFAAALLAAMMVLTLAACGSEAPAVTEAPAAAVPQTQPAEAPTQATLGEDDFFSVEDAGEDTEDMSKYEEKMEQVQNGYVTISDGTQQGQDQYLTDPVPEGQQQPVDEQVIDESVELTCYLTIDCSTIQYNMENLTEGKEGLVPADGLILPRTAVTFYQGESVFDILQRVTMDNRIHMSSRFTPLYHSAYIEGIQNLYEFDCGSGSGWMYNVNGWYPNYGVSRYMPQDGDEIQFNYTCDLGRDLGAEHVGQGK